MDRIGERNTCDFAEKMTRCVPIDLVTIQFCLIVGVRVVFDFLVQRRTLLPVVSVNVLLQLLKGTQLF